MNRLEYLETSAATGHNVAKAVELLLDLVMKRMDNAVDKAILPGLSNKSKTVTKCTLVNSSELHQNCFC